MKQAVELDEIDRRILRELQQDASLSHAELAVRVTSSAASCWRRIRAMEASGVLKQAVRLVDLAKVDRGVNVLCNVRVLSHSSDVRRRFESFVLTQSEVMECYSMSGEWDYLLRIVVADVADYERFLMRVLLEHPSVNGASSHFALSTTKYTTAVPV